MNTLRYCSFGQASPVILLIARLALVLLFIIFGFPKLAEFSTTVEHMAAMGVPLPFFSTVIAVLMETLVALLIAVGFYTRPLAILLLLYTLGTAILGHHYWNMPDEQVTANMINFYKNISIAGGFLLLSVTGPGAISLDRR